MVCGRVGVLHSRGHDLTRLSPADGDAKLATAVWDLHLLERAGAPKEASSKRGVLPFQWLLP